MLRSLFLTAFAAALTMAAPVAWAQVPAEVLLEVEGDHATPGEIRFGPGNWHPSAGKSTATGMTASTEARPIRTRYINGTEPGSATFVPVVPAAGNYEVSVTWPSSGNATNVLYTVHTANGDVNVTLDQAGWGGIRTPNGNRWVSLGTHPLPQGQAPVVTVTSQADSQVTESRNVHRVYVDGLRLVPAGGVTVAQAPSPPPPSPVAVDPVVIDPVAELPAATATTISWRTSLDAGRTEARSADRRVIVYAFTASSRGCREMEGGALADPRVIAALGAEVPVRVDVTGNESLARTLSVYRVPAVIVLNSRGEEITRRVGAMTAEELLDLIE